MRYFEDYQVGVRRKLGSRSVTEEEILRFANEFDPQPFHIDVVAAEASIFGGLIASGWHTCALTMRLLCDGFLLEAASLGSPGVDEIRWKKPVRPGDTLTLFCTPVLAKASSSKPDRGVLTNDMELLDQHGDIVMTMKAMTMLARRPAVTVPSDR